jgi:photosystem II stability/assembly factor-like uncharacterized protein
MKTLLIILLLASVVIPQQWIQQTFPLSEQPYVEDVFFINESIGFFIIGRELWRTTDGGENFTKTYQVSHPEYLLKSFFFNDTLILTGSRLLKSADLGETFIHVGSNYPGGGGSFINSQIGWIRNNSNQLWKTTNGGETWNRQYPPISTYNFHFVNENVGYLSSGASGVRSYAKTTDGGGTWSLQSINNVVLSSATIFFYNENVGHISNYYTTDGGISWSTGPGFGYGHFFRFKNNIAIWWDKYYTKHFYVSANLGVTWEKVFKPTGEWTQMEIINEQTFIYSDMYGAIYKTANRGVTWEVLTTPVLYLGRGFFIDDSTGWTSGRGNILKTTNGGEDWLFIPTNYRELINLKFLNHNRGFGLARSYNDQFSLVTTYDGGFTWNSVATFSGSLSFAEYNFYDSLFGYGVTHYCYFYTLDGGNTWVVDSTSGLKGRDIHFPTRTTGYIAGFPGFKTTDGGVTWIQRTSLAGKSIFFIDSLKGWKGYDWNLYRTSDGGQTFQHILDHGQQHDFGSFKFFDQNIGIMADRYFEYVWMTTNGGINWNEQFLHGFYNHHFNSPHLGWVFGKRGVILKYEGVVPVELLSFSYNLEGNRVKLLWQTSTETNNRGFNIERKSEVDENENWIDVAFIEGNGTTTETRSYSYDDLLLEPGMYSHRIKQIDFNGTFKYYNLNETVEYKNLYEFSLSQNYPNPFNPITKIKYSAPGSNNLSIPIELKVYDILGNEVTTLVNENKLPGEYEVEFDGRKFASGVYFYKLKAGGFSTSKKLLLLK